MFAVKDSLKEAHNGPWRVIIHTHKTMYQLFYLVCQSQIAEKDRLTLNTFAFLTMNGIFKGKSN